MDAGRDPRVCVLALTSLLTVTVEEGVEAVGPEVHVHPGGQGLWLARMARSLGADVVVCGPFGGETGRVVEHLAALDGLRVHGTPYGGSTGAYVHDRRDGRRREIVRTHQTALGRHELDDLFGTVLVEALDSDVVALTGAEPPGVVPDDFFGRLAGDLRAAGRPLVADLSGDAARAVTSQGLDVLKMSHSEMVAGGFADGEGLEQLVTGAEGLVREGVGAVVVSRAADPTLVVLPDRALQVSTPSVTTVDPRGAGDSMTAGIAVGLGRGMDVVDAVRLGAAAGALNVTRRGLGSGRREQIERFVSRVRVDED